MKDNMTEQDLKTRLENMSKDELKEFLSIASISGKACTITGIGSIIIALLYPSLITGIITFIILYIFGNLAVGADNAQAFTKKLLEIKFKDK